MASKKPMSPDEIAFDTLEHVFVTYKNEKMHRSNENSLYDANRVEHDLKEVEKEHLALLRAKLQMEIANKTNRVTAEAANSSDRLGQKVLFLNVAIAALTLVMALSALVELSQ